MSREISLFHFWYVRALSVSLILVIIPLKDSHVTVELPWQMFGQGPCSRATRGHEAYFNAAFREPGTRSLPNIWPSFIYFHSQDVSRHHRLRTIIWGSPCLSLKHQMQTHAHAFGKPSPSFFNHFFFFFPFLGAIFSGKKNYWGGNFHLSNTLVPAAPFRGGGDTTLI